ncbi:hypothetical protein F5Y16DRAFT_385846 [Xylariaceae sp. FL0255]|nr:hypothetical protein F5Y16DRAFT_385846 [Xylariaceae sp. FL0255]
MADYDDPLNWGVDEVIEKLCRPGRSWVLSPKLLPSLKGALHTQGVDGHTLLTYDDDIDLFKSLGITTLKQKNTFLHARRELRRRSKLY